MTTIAGPSVRFAQRPDRGLVLGLSATRAVTLVACVLAVAAVTVASGMTTGAITAVGVSPVAGAALLIVEGRALIEWTPDAVGYLWRGANGRLRFLAKPDRPCPAGILPIPGTAMCLAVLRAPDGSAILHDKAADTWAAIASVTGHGFLYADAETQSAATAGFGRALAAISADKQIQRIHVTHRTRPDRHVAAPMSGDATQFGAPNAAADAYREAREQHADSWRHDTLVAITLGGKPARAAIRRAGHGCTAAARVLQAHRDSLPTSLDNADVTVDTWLTPDDLSSWIRDAYDPASIPLPWLGREQPTDSIADDCVDANVATVGPMAIDESWSMLRTDSAFHQVLWVSQWPRFDTHPAFLAPLQLPAGATITVSLVYEPIPTATALRQIAREKTAQASDAALRRRLGTLDTAEQSAREIDTLQRESDLTEGHLDMNHAALIAITADSGEALADAATRTRQAAAAAGCETRVLYGQQLRAFTAVTLQSGPCL